MSWDTFWFPNIVQSTLFAAISAIVVFVVGLVLRWWWKRWGGPWVRTWASDLLVEKLQPTRDAAFEARDASRASGELATTASKNAKTAGENSEQAAAKLDIVGARLVDVLSENKGMAKRLDDVLAAYLHLRNYVRDQGIDIPPDARPELPTGELEAPLITGRHQYVDERDHR